MLSAEHGTRPDFSYHPVQYVPQPLNNPGGVRNLAYANLSLPRISPIGTGCAVQRMFRPCAKAGLAMQGGHNVIVSTYGRPHGQVASAPLFDPNTGNMLYNW